MSHFTDQSVFGLAVGRHEGAAAVVEYGEGQSEAVTVPLDPLSGARAESWFLPAVSHTRSGNYRVAEGGAHLLAAAMFERAGTLEDTVAQAYDELLSLVRGRGLHLNRIWNYVRDINGDDGGLERYRRFSVGRYEAFRRAGFRLAEDLPAASAVGAHRGPELTLIALAGSDPGKQVENPRQISAYEYPESYGPRSPSFSRATLIEGNGAARLWISGTASIVGHRTVHAGDPVAQLDETLQNLGAVLSSAGFAEGLASVRMLKVYVRRRADETIIGEHLLRAFGREVPAIWLEADICREDLLLEIEALAEKPAADQHHRLVSSVPSR